jgi:6-pyruvoyltetrahydropterin/6-carboxytetrahydropterin synthase
LQPWLNINSMFSVKIRDHIMIAHSLTGKQFAAAQNLHGATYIIDVTFFTENLNKQNIVIDIGHAQDALHKILETINYQNLDELTQFKGEITTAEFLAKHIHDLIRQKLKTAFKGTIKVTLGESHVAWASYDGRHDETAE